MPAHRSQDGFSLIELLIVITIMGITLGMSIPAYHHYMESNALRWAARDIASSIQQAHARAPSTHVAQTVHFALDSTGAGDYRVSNGTIAKKWDLLRNITDASGTGTSVVIGVDGRDATSTDIILKDAGGVRDTVSLQLSGLVLVGEERACECTRTSRAANAACRWPKCSSRS